LFDFQTLKIYFTFFLILFKNYSYICSMEITDKQFTEACEIVRTYLGLKNPQDKVEEEIKLKPIEFVKFLSSDVSLGDDLSPPQTWKYVDLVVKNYTLDGLDIMLAYDNDKYNNGVLYLGRYNDGVK
jgi:hypothetical protein